MIVYFSASARTIKKDIGTYRQILRAVHGVGGIVANNWAETAFIRGRLPSDSAWWGSMCHITQQAIEDADIVIVEASGVSSFGVGFEMAYALQNKKPILVLTKVGEERSSYARGLTHRLLERIIYRSDEELENAVKAFIRKQGRG